VSAGPLVLAGAALALLRFGRGFVRLRRRGRRDLAGWDRPLLACAGLAATAAPALGPVDEAAGRLLGAHMLEHLLVGDAGPALLAVAVRGPLLAFVLPVRLGRLAARAGALPAWAPVALWAAALAAWHVPAAYDAALGNELLHGLEHLSFLAAGLLVWTQLVDPARRRRLGTGARLAVAGAMFAAGQLLADVLFLSGPLYPAYAGAEARPLGLSAAADQQLAGLVMMVEQTVALGAFAALLLRGRVREALRPARRRAPLEATA